MKGKSCIWGVVAGAGLFGLYLKDFECAEVASVWCLGKGTSLVLMCPPIRQSNLEPSKTKEFWKHVSMFYFFEGYIEDNCFSKGFRN